MVDEYGWNEFVDQTGKPCIYCGETATETLVVRPIEGSSRSIKSRGHRVPVCSAHARASEEPPPSYRFRSRKTDDEQPRWDI